MSDADFYVLHGHETFVGPCVHGRDPWTRCDECGEGNAVDALMKRAEKADPETARLRRRVETLKGRLARVLAAEAGWADLAHWAVRNGNLRAVRRGRVWSGRRAGRGTKP